MGLEVIDRARPDHTHSQEACGSVAWAQLDEQDSEAEIYQAEHVLQRELRGMF